MHTYESVCPEGTGGIRSLLAPLAEVLPPQFVSAFFRSERTESCVSRAKDRGRTRRCVFRNGTLFLRLLPGMHLHLPGAFRLSITVTYQPARPAASPPLRGLISIPGIRPRKFARAANRLQPHTREFPSVRPPARPRDAIGAMEAAYFSAPTFSFNESPCDSTKSITKVLLNKVSSSSGSSGRYTLFKPLVNFSDVVAPFVTHFSARSRGRIYSARIPYVTVIPLTFPL